MHTPEQTDDRTHHLLQRRGDTVCIYCGKTRAELVAELGDPDVTQHPCPQAP